MSVLPLELVQVLDETFFLHVLATDPAKAIPPGKSLLSMMARPPPPAAPSPLHVEVEKVVHKAFWDEARALVSLSSPSPSVQLPRLKLLYADLHDALSPLFPATHPILLSLAAPLPPTSSPLHSTLALLTEILHALRQRCAPVRDPDIDALLADLATPPPAPAALLLSTLKSLIALAHTLKRDLSHTLLGAMSEPQLTAVLRTQARTRERELTLDPRLFGPTASLAALAAAWRTWAGPPPTSTDATPDWLPALMRALTAPTAVSCAPSPESDSDSARVPEPEPNALPPQFFFTKPALLHAQNALQALVAVASLKPLALPPPGSDFVARVWALLQAELDGTTTDLNHAPADADEDPTKIVNLADEVVRARGGGKGVGGTEEARLRAAVERTLRLRDPVFVLLQGRLARAVEERVRAWVAGPAGAGGVPETMRTGRGRVEAGAGRNGIRTAGGGGAAPVKGFEDEVLVQALEDVVLEIGTCVEWVQGVWGDTMGL